MDTPSFFHSSKGEKRDNMEATGLNRTALIAAAFNEGAGDFMESLTATDKGICASNSKVMEDSDGVKVAEKCVISGDHGHEKLQNLGLRNAEILVAVK